MGQLSPRILSGLEAHIFLYYQSAADCWELNFIPLDERTCDSRAVTTQMLYQNMSVSLPVSFITHSHSLSCFHPPSRSCQGFMHMKLTQSKDGKYVLGQNSPPFDTIPEVVHFYTTHKLPVRGAEHLSLLFPVLVQTLWLPSVVCLDLQQLFPMDTWTRMSGARVHSLCCCCAKCRQHSGSPLKSRLITPTMT